jgi:hypothetical protein
MISVKYKKLGFLPVTACWFNRDSNIHLYNYGIHRLRQSVKIESAKKQYQIRETEIKTFIVDLTLSEDQIWKGFSRSHKYGIRRIQKLIESGVNVTIEKDKHVKEFLNIANSFVRLKKYRKPITKSELNRYLKTGKGELLTIHSNYNILGGIFFLLDPPFRVRCLYGFNNRYQEQITYRLHSCYMKYLDWMAIIHYKNKGYAQYDFGGTSEKKPGIAAYKCGFGGHIVKEYDYEFASNRFLKESYPKLAYTKEQQMLIK